MKVKIKSKMKAHRFTAITNRTVKNIMLCVFLLVTVSCTSCKKEDKGPFDLSVSTTFINFGTNETTAKETEITTTAKNWEFSVEPSATWLTVEKQDNKLRFTPQGTNTASSPRSAEITVTVKNTDPVKITVTQNGTTIYNRADCEYFGNILKNGTAFFGLDLYNTSNPNIGLLMMGFCTLPNSFANFKLDAGTYNIASNGNARTLLPGMFEDGTFVGTFLYNFNTNKITFITGGTMTVSLSGNTYTINCSFTGKDAVTNAAVNNIVVSFTGTVNFIDQSNPLPEKSTYKATGKPGLLSPPGAATWTGTLEPEGSGNDKFYSVTNWGNDDIEIYLDIKDGKIVIDDYTRVVYTSTLDGYLRVGIRDGAYFTILPSYTYTVNYDPSTNILDFTGTVSYNGKNYETLLGVIGYNRATGNLSNTVFTDFYAGVKLQLTPVTTRSGSAAFQKFGGIDALRHIKSLTGAETRSFTGNNPINIVVDEEMKSQMQKIPLGDLKVIDGK